MNALPPAAWTSFEETARGPLFRLQIDGEGPVLEAPVVAADDHGFAYAWLSAEQIPAALEAVNGPGGSTYGLEIDASGDLWLLDPNDDPRSCPRVGDRYAVGPWRWTPVEEPFEVTAEADDLEAGAPYVVADFGILGRANLSPADARRLAVRLLGAADEIDPLEQDVDRLIADGEREVDAILDAREAARS